MKAIILAAGKGTRLGGLTKEIPKPMLPINGKPLLEHVINYLRKNSITQIGINLFTMSEQIVNYFNDGVKWDVNIFYSKEKELLGTAGALLNFRNWLKNDENFIVIYGDILTNQNLDKIEKKHIEKNAYATLLLHRRRKSNSYIKVDNDNRIVKFFERPNDDEINKINKDKIDKSIPGLVNSAVQILNRRVLDYIEKKSCFDLPKDVYSKVLNRENIYGVELTADRIAIDSPERYEQARLAVGQGIFDNEKK